MVLNAKRRRRLVDVDCRQRFQTLMTTTVSTAVVSHRRPRRVVANVLMSPN